jgi:hypothetical protein
MRETRTSGSEGGEVETNRPFLPLSHICTLYFTSVTQPKDQVPFDARPLYSFFSRTPFSSNLILLSNSCNHICFGQTRRMRVFEQ